MGSEQLNLQLPTLLDYRTLTLRHDKVAKIFKVQESLMEGFRKASVELGCTEIFTPTISASATEGGSDVFKIKYYDNDAFLVQSPQLYKQMLVPVFERVYLVSRAYRAEPSVTTRHLSESIQMDCELGFMDFNALLDAMEYVGRETISYVKENCAEILKEYKSENITINKDIPRLKLREAQGILKSLTGVDHTSEPDLMPEEEREICKWALSERKSDFVTITHFPTKNGLSTPFLTLKTPNIL
jgi:nondiscriminating aspartyl-tRNA synthetase